MPNIVVHGAHVQTKIYKCYHLESVGHFLQIDEFTMHSNSSLTAILEGHRSVRLLIFLERLPGF